MTGHDNRKLFIRLSMWENDIQDYLPVGTLVYDNDPSQKIGFVGFVYDRGYVNAGWAAVDPAHLDPQIDHGRFPIKERDGRVHHYFASFLPGEFGQQLLSEVDKRWETLTEAEKLYVMTFAHGDFGAPQLNPQNSQHNEPIRDLGELSRLVEAIREFQRGERTSIITPQLQGALCSFRGPKPKVDYEDEVDGIARRFVAKLNTTSYYNDARIGATFTSVEKDASINTCENRVVPLDCGEEVLFSYNYARTERFEKLEEDSNPNRIIMKYNRISFKTLLADDPKLGNVQRPNYGHICYAIDKFSADPVTDKEELFRRAILSAATNHTNNGLENIEMYDQGNGKWRLSPSFHNLPNPYADVQFECGFGDGVMTGNLLRFDEKFVVTVGKTMGFDALKSLALSSPVLGALTNLERTMSIHNLSEDDKSTVRESVKIKEVASLHQRISQNETVQHAISDGQALPTVSFDDGIEAPNHKGPRLG
ncbi:HipA domain-containing protein [Teredinibacter purpureus]|uniref:HipA domain-containing protein n=1 Tax=Teredinibacter purpureus TaxID=2731756 RepID=UPI0005F813E9|nr:HipA domain-containing protein [Teredinibacter purpureus]